jgi:hypothetical protein
MDAVRDLQRSVGEFDGGRNAFWEDMERSASLLSGEMVHHVERDIERLKENLLREVS